MAGLTLAIYRSTAALVASSIEGPQSIQMTGSHTTSAVRILAGLAQLRPLFLGDLFVELLE